MSINVAAITERRFQNLVWDVLKPHLFEPNDPILHNALHEGVLVALWDMWGKDLDIEVDVKANEEDMSKIDVLVRPRPRSKEEAVAWRLMGVFDLTATVG